MAVEHALQRQEELESQWRYIDQYIQSIDYLDHERLNQLTEEVESALVEAKKRKEDVVSAQSQQANIQQLGRIYPPFVKQLDALQMRLEDLQQGLLYLEIHHYQDGIFPERLEYAEQLCDGLTNYLGLDVDTLPVIWDGYAVFDIQLYDFYAVHLPRDEAPIRGAPIIGHEFGHLLVEQLTQSNHEPFRDRLQNFASEWKNDMQQIVEGTWREWFVELACDACGLLTFGPAYLIALTEYLCHRNPYDVVEYGHPPDALRFNLVDSLAEDVLPVEVYEKTRPSRDAFDTHLKLAVSRKPAEYDDWADQDLLNRTIEAIHTQVDADFEMLFSSLEDPTVTVSGWNELRYEANEYWIRRQNGG